MPFEDSKIVTCSMDGTVQLHSIDAAIPQNNGRGGVHTNTAGGPADHPDERATIITPSITVFETHNDRVKQVEVHPQEPALLWSASEDGTIRQYDTRLPVETMNKSTSHNVIYSVVHGGSGNSAVKSMALNPLKSHEMAVGTGDRAIKLYDRRMLSLMDPLFATGQMMSGNRNPTMALEPHMLCLRAKLGEREREQEQERVADQKISTRRM